MMTKFLAKTFLVISLFAVSIAAQEEKEKTALPVITETQVITDLRPLLSSKDSKKPLLINFWATWCGPCRYEFPELVRIDAEYRAKGLDFAIVSLDNPGSLEYGVTGFLRVYGSTMNSYLLDLSAPPEIDRAIRRIAPKSRGGLPLTMLFDAKGRLVYEKAGVIDPTILKEKIDKVLGIKPRAENVK